MSSRRGAPSSPEPASLRTLLGYWAPTMSTSTYIRGPPVSLLTLSRVLSRGAPLGLPAFTVVHSFLIQ
eukprot:5776159-Prorocentrum_lima.AAC.1